ncbi:MAG: helix-turn-helix domain-containing protein [Puniceicoccales bacterium]
MPRDLTTFTKAAKNGILELLKTHPDEKPLPSLRQLADDFDLHSTTIFRILHDLEAEGLVWQGPSRRFYPAGSKSNTLKGKPVCFIGRKIQEWSQLYQEIIEGIAEVCAANESPLILQSAPELVQVPVQLEPAILASEKDQKTELKRLLKTVPNGCAGFILDHLWSDAALRSLKFPAGQCIQLLAGTGKYAKVISPNYEAGSQLIANYVKSRNFDQVYLVEANPEEPLLHQSMAHIQETLADISTHSFSYYDKAAIESAIASIGPHCCFICIEDNTALGLADQILASESAQTFDMIEMLAIQGTGVVTAPHTRLRYDYRRLGRAAASSILHGTAIKQMAPRLVTRMEED